MEKAFELVDHSAILDILARKGVKGRVLAYIKDYLQDRSARVNVQGTQSEFYPLENGVPQGGILSTILFNVPIVVSTAII